MAELTGAQLRLLDKLVQSSKQISEGQTTEFIVHSPLGGPSCAMFLSSPSLLVNLPASDLTELVRARYVVDSGYAGATAKSKYQVTNEGLALFRNASEIADEQLTQRFATGDPELDDLLETAFVKYRHHDFAVRKEAAEKLWDAWERVKTLEQGPKQVSAKTLLDRAAAEPKFRTLLEDESKTLTSIGNDFRIRHHETDKLELADSAQLDYFFERLNAMIRLLLRKSGRA